MNENNGKLKHMHAKIGLAWNMYPKDKCCADHSAVFEMTQNFREE
jgi:hypothetical protein